VTESEYPFQPRLGKCCRRMLASCDMSSNWWGSIIGRNRTSSTKKNKSRSRLHRRVCLVQRPPAGYDHGFHNSPFQSVFSQRNVCQALSSPVPSCTPPTYLHNLQIYPRKRPIAQTISTTSHKQWVPHACRRKRSGTDRRYNGCLWHSRRDLACW
jgi:hypothetical protein